MVVSTVQSPAVPRRDIFCIFCRFACTPQVNGKYSRIITATTPKSVKVKVGTRKSIYKHTQNLQLDISWYPFHIVVHLTSHRKRRHKVTWLHFVLSSGSYQLSHLLKKCENLIKTLFSWKWSKFISTLVQKIWNTILW